jgi:ABC-type dipeptide/oligopeptide/nickel transport system permease component
MQVKKNMLHFGKFLLRRLIAIPISLIIITMLLYAGVMLTPPEVRVTLFYVPRAQNLTEEQIAHMIEVNIEKYHLRDPFLVQYSYWVKSFLQGTWGYSPTLREDVLPALIKRTPATAELTLYSLLLFIPLGLISGVVSGWNQRKAVDNLFRLAAFISTSFPPFILSIVLIAVLYVSLDWLAPSRLSSILSLDLAAQGFIHYTGMYTLDGLLNHRLDVTWDAFRHLVMPVVTLSLYHWATLMRITRSSIIAERTKEYIIAARARGVNENMIMWKHAFRNTLAPSFTSLALSAASLVTGVFVVEIIYSYTGISGLIVRSMATVPDPAAALGFSVYSVIIVLGLMFVMDILLAVFDPRVRDEVFHT